MSPGPAGNNSSTLACPSLITADTSHLKEEIVLGLCPSNLSGHLLYSIEQEDQTEIFQTPQKIFLSGTPFNLLSVHCPLHQWPSEKLSKLEKFELNTLAIILTEQMNSGTAFNAALFYITESRHLSPSHLKVKVSLDKAEHLGSLYVVSLLD